MNTSSPTLGIDIAKASFVAAFGTATGKYVRAQFSNSPAGFKSLSRWLFQHLSGPVRVGLESTGTYAEALCEWLHQHHHQVYLLNPERVSHYARCLGQANKTDPADAVTLAKFVAAHPDLMVWTPMSAEQKTLRNLTRARTQLVETQRTLVVQLQTTAENARKYLEAVLSSVRQQIKTIEADIRAHVKSCPEMKESVRRLCTCKGVGFVTAAVVLSELPPLGPDTDARAIVCWAGLNPRRIQSGKSEGLSRLSCKGNSHLRHALYMPAIVAKKHNPLLRSFALRLAQKPRRTSSIIGAISHKLLRILVGMLKHKTDFHADFSPQQI